MGGGLMPPAHRGPGQSSMPALMSQDLARQLSCDIQAFLEAPPKRERSTVRVAGLATRDHVAALGGPGSRHRGSRQLPRE